MISDARALGHAAVVSSPFDASREAVLGMDQAFRIDGFLPALLGALIVSFVGFMLSHMLRKSL
jgi:hypothetical protein